MNPKKKVDIIAKTVENTNYKQSDVEDVVNFYWKQGVYEKLRELPYFSLYIPELGNFEFIRKNIPVLIRYYEEREDEEMSKRLENLQKMLFEDYARKNNLREKKKQFYDNLEKQVENTGGNLV